MQVALRQVQSQKSMVRPNLACLIWHGLLHPFKGGCLFLHDMSEFLHCTSCRRVPMWENTAVPHAVRDLPGEP